MPSVQVAATSKLDPHLRLHPGSKRVLDLLHLGDEIGDLDQFVLGIAAGDDDMLVGRLVAQNLDDLLGRQIVITQDDVELIEQDKLRSEERRVGKECRL